MRIIELAFMGPLKGDGPPRLEHMFLLETEPGQLARYQNLVHGREVSITVLASDDYGDHLPNLIDLSMLDAENARREQAKQTDQGNDSALVN